MQDESGGASAVERGTRRGSGELFDGEFRRMLRDVAARVRQVRAKEDERATARRRQRDQAGSFAGHQAYSPGDDLRRIDWNAYARSGELFVKLFEAEQRRAITVLLDGSASMQAGAAPRFDGARRLVAVLGALALSRLGGLGLHTVDGEVRWYGRLGELDRLLEDLAGLRAEAVDQSGLLEAWARGPRRRGLGGRVVWLSDFAIADEVQAGLRRLTPVRRHLLGMHPRQPSDREPPSGGRVELRCPEHGTRLHVRVDARLRDALRHELELLERQRVDCFRRAGVPLLSFDLPDAGERRASEWLRGGDFVHRL